MCMLSKEKFTLENMLENNCHGRYASFFKNHELKEADKYIKRVFPNAEFYIDYEHALVFERIGEDEEIVGNQKLCNDDYNETKQKS